MKCQLTDFPQPVQAEPAHSSQRCSCSFGRPECFRNSQRGGPVRRALPEGTDDRAAPFRGWVACRKRARKRRRNIQASHLGHCAELEGKASGR